MGTPSERIPRPRQWGLRSQWDFGANVTALFNKGDEAFLTGTEDDQENVLALLDVKFEPEKDDEFSAAVKKIESDGQRRTRPGRLAVYREYHRLAFRRKMYPQRTIGDRT